MKKLISTFIILTATLLFAAPSISVRPSKSDGMYGKDEKIQFQLKATSETLPATINISIIANGKNIHSENASTEADGSLVYSYTPSIPGNIRLVAKLLDAEGKPTATALTGTMYRADELRAGLLDEPKDFDLFWEQAKKELAAVPMNAELKDISEKLGNVPSYANFNIYDVRVDCAGPRPVSGILTIPKDAKEGTLNAVVFFYSAAVCGANPRTHYKNSIIFEVNAHGIDNLREGDYYKKLDNTWLNNYPQIGKEFPRSYYFYGMYLRVLRSLEYIKSRPEWNGKVLAVTGGSQGGGQTIFAGAMDPDITFVLADVPAHCDYSAQLNDHKPGWPYIVQYDADKKLQPTCTREAITAGYFDSVFFARRIKARQVFFSTNLLDDTCPSTGVFAAYNELPQNTEKHMHTNPGKYHWPPDRDGEFFMMDSLGIKP